MQKYTEIDENKTLRESRELLLTNDKTAISCNSGPAFPTINLQPGMLCFRTDEQKLYQLNANGETWVALFDLSNNKGLVSKATIADNALKVNEHTVNSDVPVNAKFTDTTYGAVTDSASGLMTAAQKKKLDDLSNYSLPVASASTLGGVKVGDGLTITDGILSSSVTGGNATHGEKLFTTNDTFVVPEGVSILVVTAVGGGGGGGGGGENSSGHAGNGSRGNVASAVPVFVHPSQSISVVIGQGGAGGVGGANGSGGSGGTGGAGSPAGSNGAGGSYTSGGHGGAGGSANGTGGHGGAGGVNGHSTRSGGGGGGGGATAFGDYVFASGGGGGGGGSYSSAGSGASVATNLYDWKISTAYGSGGSGGSGNNFHPTSGGAGTSGCVYVVW